ncbi:condensation domain-containing protein [Polymorphospora rubra]|uniref:condensation domain-containing protein n=1 Tax=Polymorphospora rubra TaxID=338584 RepID=UPI0033F3F018
MADRGEVAGPVPATAMQEALWWVHQRARNRSVYNLTWRLATDRPLDRAALRDAWQSLVDRHETLRTSIHRRDGRVELDVAARLPVDVARIEIDDPGSADPATLLRLLAEELQEREFALDSAPLARLTHVRVGAVHELVLTVHHVVLDGWAIQLLMGELSQAYAAAGAGRPVSWPADPVPFSTYAREHAAARADDRWAQSLRYWRNTLADATAATLEPDLPGELASGAPGAIVRYGFSADAATGIAALAKVTFGTPFAIVLAAAQIVLARGGAGSDVTLGVVVANRMTARDQALVGYTANLCTVRAGVRDTDTVLDVVGRARDGMWAMLTHQAVPYPVVFEALPSDTQTALGDTAPLLLSYLGPIGNDLRLGDVPVRLLPSPNRAARADLAMSTWETDGEYLAEIEFNTSRYRPDTVLRFLHDLDAVLADGGAEPARTVGSLAVGSRARTGRGVPAGAAAHAAPLPQTAVWRQVVAAWTELLGGPPAGPDVNFFAVGGNSLRALQFVGAVQPAGGPAVDIVRWLGEPTPRRLVDQLTDDPAEPAAEPSTLVRLRDGTGPHLHLLPGAGGSPRDYQDLVAALPGDWLVTASTGTEFADVPAMARAFQADLAAAGLVPDVLGGWSMGGQIAYQMAADRPGRRPLLVLLDSAPPTGYPQPGDAARHRFAEFVESVQRSSGVRRGPRAATTGDRPDAGFDGDLASGALAACLAGVGHPVPARLLAQRWRGYERHSRAVASYVHTGPVDTPALVVAAELLDTQLTQWAERLGPTRSLRVTADHHAVLGAPVAVEIAEAITDFVRVVETQV